MKKIRIFLIAIIAIAGMSSAFTTKPANEKHSKFTVYYFYHLNGVWTKIPAPAPAANCTTGDTYCSYSTQNLANPPLNSYTDAEFATSGIIATGIGTQDKQYVPD